MWPFTSRRPKESSVEPQVPETIATKPAWLRLVSQLTWYDTQSVRCQKWYKRLKFVQIGLAVGIPLASGFSGPRARIIVGSAGAVIAFLEGIQGLNQYATLWQSYRSTAERLKHEKYLFLSEAGPYKALPEDQRLVLLAERVEEQVSSEHANWIDETRRVAKGREPNARQ
jgi:hypothetical protein